MRGSARQTPWVAYWLPLANPPVAIVEMAPKSPGPAVGHVPSEVSRDAEW